MSNSVWYILYVKFCTVYFICQILYGIFYMSNSVRYILYVKFCTVYFICQILYGILYMSNSVRCILYVKFCTVYFICQILYGIFYMSNSVQYILHNLLTTAIMTICEILSLYRGGAFALLRCFAAYSGSCLPTMHNIKVSSPRVKHLDLWRQNQPSISKL